MPPPPPPLACRYCGAEDDFEFNTEEAYRRCKLAGANAICTDKPTLLQALLAREGPLTRLEPGAG